MQTLVYASNVIDHFRLLIDLHADHNGSSVSAEPYRWSLDDRHEGDIHGDLLLTASTSPQLPMPVVAEDGSHLYVLGQENGMFQLEEKEARDHSYDAVKCPIPVDSKNLRGWAKGCVLNPVSYECRVLLDPASALLGSPRHDEITMVDCSSRVPPSANNPTVIGKRMEEHPYRHDWLKVDYKQKGAHIRRLQPEQVKKATAANPLVRLSMGIGSRGLVLDTHLEGVHWIDNLLAGYFVYENCITILVCAMAAFVTFMVNRFCF